jgi:uncharacterized membrane protein YuzA (DUF378 family)
MIDGTVFEHGYLAAAVWLIVEIAALNWTLLEFFDYNAVAELLPADVATIAYGVIGVAALISLADSIGVIEDLSEVMN